MRPAAADSNLQQFDLARQQGGDPTGDAGRLGGEHGKFFLTELAPLPRYEKIVEVHGGYGEMVDDPQQVLPALKRTLKIVKEKRRQAVSM